MNRLPKITRPSTSLPRKLACAAALAAAALAAPVPAADADSPIARSAAHGTSVSPHEHRVAVGAVKRVERKMRRDGAHRSDLQGCWVDRGAVDCTGVVYGRDSVIKWRCIVLLTVRKKRRRLVPRLTDAVCTAEETASAQKPRR